MQQTKCHQQHGNRRWRAYSSFFFLLCFFPLFTLITSSTSAEPSWWETMFEGLPGNFLNNNQASSHQQPVNRRGHSATYHIDNQTNTEWMIISGGYTDDDYDTFPIWAYDLTAGKTMEEYIQISSSSSSVEEQNEFHWNVDELDSYIHPWVSIAFQNNYNNNATGGGINNYSNQDHPKGRVGHLSSTYNDCLYIFGGLTYTIGFVSVEYPNDGYNSLVIWRGCGLNHYLNNKREEQQNHQGAILVWEKIIPKVFDRYPEEPNRSSSSNSSDDVGNTVTTTNTTAFKEVDGDDNNNHDKKKRGKRNLTTNTNKNIVGEGEDGGGGQKTTTTKATTRKNPLSILPRGEARGGHYVSQDDHKEYFIFHGGVIQGDLDVGEIALGDVWKYDYEENTLTLLSSYPPLSWQCDERTELYPLARTAHAGTVVGEELIIHGGMQPSEDAPPSSSSFSSPSASYATYKTTSKWKPLTDVWVFNLKTLKWKERIQYPQLARSYHTLVGRDDGEIAAFGGFQQDSSQFSSDTVVFVYKDLLISRPNETYWLKVMPSAEGQLSELLNFQSRSRTNYLLGITNRLEHSAIIDKDGTMYVWGGRFQTVSQISGLWKLDVFTDDANLKLEIAPPDGIEEYEKELEVVHLFVLTMMFLSLTVSSFLSNMRRRGEEQETLESPSRRRGGLSQHVIDFLPVKRYEAPGRSVTEDGDIVEDVSLSRETSREEGNLQLDADCCPICFDEYEEGVSEIKTLPCGHAFDKECIDSWLEGHTTCPACRQRIENSPLSPTSEANTTQQSDSILMSRSWLAGGLPGILLHVDWSTVSANESESVSPSEAASFDTSNNDYGGVEVAASRSQWLRRLFNRRVQHERIPAHTSNELELA